MVKSRKTVEHGKWGYPNDDEQIRMHKILERLFSGFNPKGNGTVRVHNWHRDNNGIWHFEMERGVKCTESMIEADYHSEFFKVEKRYSLEIDNNGKVISMTEPTAWE